MGILNVTPDSFSDGGLHDSVDLAVNHCKSMIEAGADIIDIGGYSTRPGSGIVTEEEEFQRVIPVLKAIRVAFPDIPISVDTFRSMLAMHSIALGADIINDISGGLFDEQMLNFIGSNHIPYVMTHCIGTPETMHLQAVDEGVHKKVKDFFAEQSAKLQQYGDQQIILDPGIGFGKTIEANYRLLSNLEQYRVNGFPIMIGISRKSMIFKTLDISPKDSDNGTSILNTIALMNGADIIRVHDVAKAREAVRLVEEFRQDIAKE